MHGGCDRDRDCDAMRREEEEEEEGGGGGEKKWSSTKRQPRMSRSYESYFMNEAWQ